ncbi:hypothetical protein [Ochrobactrum sp. A-1]|uniref:hypothetical protein n=1 Tax=Ochrobactrum sp. A-1 TaxID=2920940 RepID=UPI001F0A1A5E|nr:hypothetical protein [Ochrobactrum sp. A-1]
MPIRSNGYYNDPGFAQAASNLASLFAPPSGSDAAGWAAANAKNAEARRLADFFQAANDPSVAREALDRMGIGAGAYAPNQSYYSVDLGDQTTRRGQDISAATSVANNQNTVRGSTIASLYGALNPGQVRPEVPENIAATIGLPTVGEVSGAPKAPSMDEVQAAVFGQLTPDQQRAKVMHDVPVEQVVGPDGTPQFVTRNDAIGQQPYNKGSVSELAQLQTERAALPAGDPRIGEYDARISALGRGQQQSRYDAVNDEDLAKENATIASAASTALADRKTYDVILAAAQNPNVDQGSMANAKLQLRKMLNAFGVDMGDTAPAEMLNALGNQLALKLRDPSSGAGMPGAMSDADREYLKSMSISLGNTPQANALLAQYYIGSQQRAIDLNNLRTEYVKEHGRLDEGWRAAKNEYLRNYDPTEKLRTALAGKKEGDTDTGSAVTPPSPPSPPTPPAPARFERGPDGRLRRVTP